MTNPSIKNGKKAASSKSSSENRQAELRASDAIMREAREFSESIVETVREPLLVLDELLRVVLANRAFYSVFKATPEETIGQFIYDLGNKQWDIPALRELLEQILPQETVFNDVEVRHVFPLIGPRIMLLNARQVKQKEPAEQRILLAIEDITEKKLAEEQLQRLNVVLEQQVEQRTAELSDVNERLRKEVQRHVSTIEELNITSEELEKVNKEYREVISGLQTINEDLNDRLERLSERSRELASQSSELVDRLEELSRTERFLNNFLDSFPMGLAVLDQYYRVMIWNNAAEKLWGRKRNNMLQRPIFELAGKDSEKEFRKAFTSAIFGDYPGLFSFILPATDSDGNAFSCRITIVITSGKDAGRFLLLMERATEKA
jgi:PAS domain S-box-containing protein